MERPTRGPNRQSGARCHGTLEELLLIDFDAGGGKATDHTRGRSIDRATLREVQFKRQDGSDDSSPAWGDPVWDSPVGNDRARK